MRREILRWVIALLVILLVMVIYTWPTKKGENAFLFDDFVRLVERTKIEKIEAFDCIYGPAAVDIAPVQPAQDFHHYIMYEQSASKDCRTETIMMNSADGIDRLKKFSSYLQNTDLTKDDSPPVDIIQAIYFYEKGSSRVFSVYFPQSTDHDGGAVAVWDFKNGQWILGKIEYTAQNKFYTNTQMLFLPKR